ncbi:MAG: M1 family metallopeptidase [Bacteroidales bacterium]|jgi:hypothetical protein
MNKLIFALLPVVLNFGTWISVVGQNQPALPREIAVAVKNGTRSMNGNPGVNYWQNHANYHITAQVDVKTSTLTGTEWITYYNESPDTLTYLVVRLYQDFFKKGNARSWSIGPQDLTDGTTIDKLLINNQKVDVSDSKIVNRSATNMQIQLEKAMLPGDSLLLETSWTFHIPEKTPVRMGKYSDNILFVAYWYPQIAVFDDINGWDEIEYLGIVEFYNDFNNYNVTVSVPSDFKIWATGELQNAEQHFTRKVMDRIEKAKTTGEITTFFTADECKTNKVLQNSTDNPWHFIAYGVPDFTFGMAREVNWDGSFVTVDSTSGRQVLVDAVFPDSSLTFSTASKWAARSIQLMSFEMPGVAFPYPHMTTFSNGRRTGGMESPMMAVNGDPVSESQAFGLFYHEISHTYFPFYMGANERKYAWMDEGWAAYTTNEIMNIYDPDDHYFDRLVSTFETMSGREKEIPLICLSYQIQDYSSYRVHAYNRSALALAYLRNILGDDLFKEAFQQFINTWHGRHPDPFDFFNSFNKTSHQNLWWYFTPWYFDRAYADLGIKKVTFDNKIVIENVGGLPLPIHLQVFYVDGSQEEIDENTSLWAENTGAVVVQVDSDKKIEKVILGSPGIPDVEESNNTIIPVYH